MIITDVININYVICIINTFNSFSYLESITKQYSTATLDSFIYIWHMITYIIMLLPANISLYRDFLYSDSLNQRELIIKIAMRQYMLILRLLI